MAAEAISKQSGTPIKITFLINAGPEAPFWQSQRNYAEAVAKALDVELNVAYVPAKYVDRFGVVDYVADYMSKLKQRPDLMISALWLGAEEKMLQIMHSHNMPYLSINTHLSDKHFALLGQPRENYPQWLGHISTDDVKAGRQVADYLIDEINRKKQCVSPCPINLFGFSGLAYTSASQMRELGLKQSIKTHANIHLFNLVHADWDQQKAYAMMPTILNRHDDIDGYWIASDVMAFGILRGLKESGRKNTAMLASIDWSTDMVEHIANGEVSASYGGHFMEAGWAITLYADYRRAGDFAEKFGTVFYADLARLDRLNIESVGKFLSKPQWNSQAIRQNSRFYNPGLKRYSFDAAAIIEQQIKFNRQSAD